MKKSQAIIRIAKKTARPDPIRARKRETLPALARGRMRPVIHRTCGDAEHALQRASARRLLVTRVRLHTHVLLMTRTAAARPSAYESLVMWSPTSRHEKRYYEMPF